MKQKNSSDEGSEKSQGNDSASIQEGLRIFNLKLRRKFESALISLQSKIIEEKKSEYGIENTPPSIFGVANYINQHFEKVKQIAINYTSDDAYLESINDYFAQAIDDIVVYDVYYNLQKYQDFSQLGTLYLFFHSIENENESYPLYFLEVEVEGNSSEFTLKFPRDLVLLNMPAINYFKFENVLTIPRASSLSNAQSHLGAIESFLQNQYGFQSPFIQEPTFPAITHADKNLPAIKCRIGFQTIEKEDKKLLDYSELMSQFETGSGSKFAEFIDQYIKGTVPNHQEEVDKVYKEQYPLNSPKRYISDSPIPLNQSQKRILLALANDKNKVIVVDGPPGTGKSHTIAALTYWANEKNKSVVITSHKTEALDVIDRMLTDKFKELHPQAKPSIVRMDSSAGSENNLMNTLQTSVIAAASQRSLDFNDVAVKNDASSISDKLQSLIKDRLDQKSDYPLKIKELVEMNSIEESLSKIDGFKEAIDTVVTYEQEINLSAIAKLLSEKTQELNGISLDEYQFLAEQKDNLPSFLEACEKLYSTSNNTTDNTSREVSLPQDFVVLISKLKDECKLDIPIEKLTAKDRTRGLLGSFFGKGVNDKELADLLKKLNSLAYKKTLSDVASTNGQEVGSLSLKGISDVIERIQLSESLMPYSNLIASYKALPGNGLKDITQIYTTIQKYTQTQNLFDLNVSNSLRNLFSSYEKALKLVEIDNQNLGTLSKVNIPNSNAYNIWLWIQIHAQLSSEARASNLNPEDVTNSQRLKQKEVEHINDQRIKNFNNHLGEMARIKVSFEGGKRLSKEEIDVLLSSVSAVIAEPSTISRHFPMEEDSIDILIIDESSQVSIADSISLMLRAKQVVIFGDEYQYGAVSAVNVSSKYSTSYFNEIIRAYSDDYKKVISDEEKRELVDEVARDQDAEEQQSDTLLRPQDGTILWLKTFNIRTSTLTFAKAIANYTTSLREHFRSFPEIIGYSNEYFYKPAQMELLVNRIRTKPIGEVLQFIEVKCQGKSGQNVNLDEIEAIGKDIQERLGNGYKGTIGIITSFKEQQARLEQYLNEHFNMPQLKRDHKIAVWFVGDVQGEERDIIYYSFVEVKDLGIASLASIYPVVGGTADNIRSLKMQRLNVGFSRAKDTMVFVHSQPIESFSNTRLGDALKFYHQLLESNKANDFFIEDESVFDSPMEKKLYSLLLDTKFVKDNRDNIKIVPQFNIGKYIAQEYAASIPKYRADFLLTYTKGGKEKVLILEYDGVEYHFKNPSEVDQMNFSQEYLEYDISRQLELESYGYAILRINKFNLRPKYSNETEVDVLNNLISERMN